MIEIKIYLCSNRKWKCSRDWVVLVALQKKFKVWLKQLKTFTLMRKTKINLLLPLLNLYNKQTLKNYKIILIYNKICNTIILKASVMIITNRISKSINKKWILRDKRDWGRNNKYKKKSISSEEEWKIWKCPFRKNNNIEK